MIKSKFFKNFKFLIKTKFSFRAPPSKEIIIFGHGADQMQFLNQDKFIVYYNYGEEVNLYILFKTILIKGLKNLKHNYRIIFLKSVNPKYIITYRCDNKNFYELKNHLGHVKTILIQWGKTRKEHFANFDKEKNNYHVDQMYLHGAETAKIFSTFIKGKTFSIGSIANNRFRFDEKIKKDSLLFISQAKSNRILPEIEKIIIKFLKDYCLEKKLRFAISTRVLPEDLSGKHKYEKILGKSGWNYYPRSKPDVTGDYEHYSKVMQSNYIVSIDSTLGYEALSRKKRVAFFPLGSYSEEWCRTNYITDSKTKAYYIPSKFGYPLNLSREGDFWLSDYQEAKMTKILNFLQEIKYDNWIKLLDNLGLEKIIKFDLYNKTLISNLNNLGVPLQKDKEAK